jgi:secreted trypsin-like serine protease
MHLPVKGVASAAAIVCFLMLLVGAAQGAPSEPADPSPSAGRIVGGTVDDYKETKWIAALIRTDKHTQWCGGSLIASRYVLTAAHCTINTNRGQWTVRLGSKRWDRGGVTRKVDRITEYPNYNRRTLYGDLSVLTLSRPVSYRPVDVVPSGTHYVTDPAANKAYIAGWGALRDRSGPYPRKLHSTWVWLLQDRFCNQGQVGGFNGNVDVCAGAQGKDTCAGDSGGPLAVWDGSWWQLVGVTSYGPARCGSSTSAYAWVGAPILHRWLYGS